MSNRAQIYFAIIAGLHLLGIYLSIPVVIYLTKPLLLLSLAIIFYTSMKSPAGKFEHFLMAGLLFSWVGDIMLLFSGAENGLDTLFFLGGLGSFLMAHIGYILAFYYYPRRGMGMDRIAALLFYGLALCLVAFLWPELDSVMKIAISIYALTISTMGTFAFGMFQKLPYRSAFFILFGALCFIFSDSLIALDQFGSGYKIWMPRLMIMGSYILAQYLIVRGSLQASLDLRQLNAARVTTSPDGKDQAEG